MAECWVGTWCILRGQHSESIAAVMRSRICRPSAILNTEIRRICPSPWRFWMYLEKMTGVNLDRLAVCPDSDIPPIITFFPFFFLFFSIFYSIFILLLFILLFFPFLYFSRPFYAYFGTTPSDYYRTALTICLSKYYRPLLIYKFQF